MHLVENIAKYDFDRSNWIMYVIINYTSCWSYEGVAEDKVEEVSGGIFNMDLCIIKTINKIPARQLLNLLWKFQVNT